MLSSLFAMLSCRDSDNRYSATNLIKIGGL